MGFYQVHIGAVDHAVTIQVVAEVRGGYRLTYLTLDFNEVRPVHRALGVRIGDEKAEVDVIRATTIFDVRNPDGHDLFVSHACQRDAHFVAWTFDSSGVLNGHWEESQTNTVSADRKSYAGTYDTKFYDLNDNFLFEDSGTLSATRLLSITDPKRKRGPESISWPRSATKTKAP